MIIQLYKLFTTVIDLAITTEDERHEVTNPLTSHNCGLAISLSKARWVLCKSRYLFRLTDKWIRKHHEFDKVFLKIETNAKWGSFVSFLHLRLYRPSWHETFHLKYLLSDKPKHLPRQFPIVEEYCIKHAVSHHE